MDPISFFLVSGMGLWLQCQASQFSVGNQQLERIFTIIPPNGGMKLSPSLLKKKQQPPKKKPDNIGKGISKYLLQNYF